MSQHQRVAVITGASSGIGTELARVFAERGYSLVLVARRGDRLQALATELRGSKLAVVEPIVLDLGDPDAPAHLLEILAGKGIVIHTLVNNAGFGLRGMFATLPSERQMAMLEINVAAVTRLCRLTLPGLIDRRCGGIINVASMAAFQAGPNMAVYFASKAFVLSLSEALYKEAKPNGVVVSCLCPGPTKTEFAAIADASMTPVFRFGGMSAGAVARAGVDGYEAGRAIIVPGAANLLGSLASRLSPRWLTRRAAGRLHR